MQNEFSLDIPTECRRCGTCCRKGGPTLRLEDRPLVEAGALALRLLVTIRIGEIAREPESGRLVRVEAEMIKLKGAGSGWTCILFDEARNLCTDYDRRTAECRAMSCWDTSEIERIMKTSPLSRRDLLYDVAGVWDLVAAHERRCGLSGMDALSAAVRDGDEPAADELMAMIRYDRALRELLVEKGGDAQHLEFLFGRPLECLLDGFGLRLYQKDGRTEIAIM
ncbi:MAG: YkgJ family cysteine cluster protein [Desulfobacterales bacterium]|nr:YkgJ family cysteine cluster protein [Desulfobacterales bacterium]